MRPILNTSMPGADSYPRWLWWVLIIAASPVFAYFLYNGEHLRALIGSLSVGVVLSLAITMRRDIHAVFYWLLIAACAAFHLVLVMSITVEWRNFAGTVFTPFAVVDLMVWQWLFVSTSKIVNRIAQPAEGPSHT